MFLGWRDSFSATLASIIHEIMSRAIVKTTFEASRTLRPIYTGGSTALDASGRLLAACVGEDAVIVGIETGDQLASLEGVSLADSGALNGAQSADSMYCM